MNNFTIFHRTRFNPFQSHPMPIEDHCSFRRATRANKADAKSTHVCLPLPAAPCERSKTGRYSLSPWMKLSVSGREETSPDAETHGERNGSWPLRKSVKGRPRRDSALPKGSGCHVTVMFAGYTELGVWYTRPWKAQCSMGYQNSGATSA